MTMTSHKVINRNKKSRNVKKSAKIKYELNCLGLNFTSIARELGISPQAVFQSVNDLDKIGRVDEWIRKNIGLSF